MNDFDKCFINRIAELWVELGGDSQGVVWTWPELRDRVQEIINGDEKN